MKAKQAMVKVSQPIRKPIHKPRLPEHGQCQNRKPLAIRQRLFDCHPSQKPVLKTVKQHPKPAASARDLQIEKSLQAEKKKPKARCEHILFKDSEQNCMKEFKAFKERDIDFMSHPVMKVELVAITCDNDCDTENEQIETSVDFLGQELQAAVQSYTHDPTSVHNMLQFAHDRALLLKKHRVY